MRFINFLHENLGSQFLQGLDKLIVYRLVNELRQLYRYYSLNLGGGPLTLELQAKHRSVENNKLVSVMRQMFKQINGNYESLSLEHLQNYNALIKMMQPKVTQPFIQRMQTIGKLQLLRRLITKQCHHAAKMESQQYTNVLETLNESVLNNLQEVKENAISAYTDLGEELKIGDEGGVNMTGNMF